MLSTIEVALPALARAAATGQQSAPASDPTSQNAALHPEPIHGNVWQTSQPATALQKALSVPSTVSALQQARSAAAAKGAGVVGFAQGVSQEVASLDMSTTRTFANADGTLTTQAYKLPVNYAAADGTWHHTDPTLRAASDGSIHNAAGPVTMRFGGTLADAKLLELTVGGQKLSLGTPLQGSQQLTGPAVALLPAKPVPAIVSGSAVDYPSIWPGIDLGYRNGARSVGQLITLHAAPTGTGDLVFRFPVTASGLTAQINPQGGVDFLDSKGAIAVSTPVGVAGDSLMDPQSGSSASTPLTYALGPAGSWIDVIAPGAWLRDPARKYPVVIDPTFIQYGVGSGMNNDAYINTSGPNSNYHARWDAGQSEYTDWFGYYNCCAGTNWTLMDYDFSQLNGMTITSASWNAYFEWTSACAAQTYWITRVTTGWNPTGVTWNSRPAYAADSTSDTAAANTTCGHPRNWRSVNITSFVQGWTSGAYPNAGIMLSNGGWIGDNWRWFKIASDETSISGAWSHVDVNWTNSPGPAPTSPPNGIILVGPTMQPTLTTATCTFCVQYQFEVGTDPTFAQVSCVSGGLASPSWPVAAGCLGAGKTYYWRAWANNGYNWTNWSAAWNFSTSGPVNWGFAASQQNPSAAPQDGNSPFPGPAAGQTAPIQVYVVNQGAVAWPASGNFQLGYHLFNGAGTNLSKDAATLLPIAVSPSTGAWVTITVPSMTSLSLGEGSYILQFDMIEQGVEWYSWYGGGTANFRILVAAPPSPSSPATGTTITAGAGGSLQPTLTSNTCTACTGYQFQISTRSDFAAYVTTSPWAATPSWQVPAGTLQPGTTYYWRSIGRDQYQSGTSWSTSYSLVTPQVPSAPTIGTPTAGAGSASVSWSAPTNGGSAITGYVVTPYLNDRPLAVCMACVTGTSATLTGLVNGGSYTFTVAAQNVMGTGPASLMSASATPATLPSTPASVSAIPGYSQATVTWASAAGNGSAITGYTITPYISGSPLTPATVSASARSAAIGGLSNGTGYTFAVSATNGLGTGPASAQTAAVTPGVAPTVALGFDAGQYARGTSATITASLGTAGVSGQPTVVLGSTTVQSTTQTVGAGTAAAFPFTASGSGTVTSLSAYIVSGATASVGLYTDSGGAPGTLLTSGTISSPAANAWSKVTVPAASVASGVKYWIAVLGTGGTLKIVAVDGPNEYDSSQNTLTSLPATYSVGADHSYGLASLYATATAGGGSIPNVSLSLPVPSGFDGSGSTVTVIGQSCGAGGVTCTTSATQITVGGLTVPSAGATVTMTVRALGADSNCIAPSVMASVTSAPGQGGVGSASAAICDGGLGMQRWWSLPSTPIGPGGSAAVNVANGNLVVSQGDSTSFQLHGHLGLGTTRTYNSQLTAHTSGESLGLGWTTSWVGAGDRLGGVALRVPFPEPVASADVITLIDDSGARATFAPTGAGTTNIDITGLGATTGPLGPLTPTTLAVGGSYNRLCINALYASEAGVHASMWRYVESTTGGCTGLTSGNASVLGFATMTVDRVRREFAADGRLLSVRDASGNRVDLSYDASLRLTRVGETGGSARAYSLTYTLWSGGPEIDVTDPAGRLIKYQDDGSNHLLNVINPDGTALHYTYNTSCGGSVDQLCSTQDAVGGAVQFQYTGVALGPPQLTRLTSRLGVITSYTYPTPAAPWTTAVVGGEAKRFASIDPSGRVGELDEGDTSGTWAGWLRVQLNSWDSPSCRQPDAGVDNNLCDILRLSLNNSPTPNRETVYTYNDEGGILTQRDLLGPVAAATDIFTTASYAAQYVEAGGTVNAFTDTVQGSVAGAGSVSSTGSSRRDGNTVMVISDQTAVLKPNGNVPSPPQPYANYLTTYGFDASSAVGAGLALSGGGACSGTAANSGLLCLITAPSKDGAASPDTKTTYTYDSFGQRITMKTPDENANSVSCGGPCPPYTYTYYQNADTDLSGTTHAGGWLLGVTDPTGNFTASSYDAAGKVVRSWDRAATAKLGLAQASYSYNLQHAPPPPSSGFTATTYGACGPSSFAGSWRCVLNSVDALGNTTSYQHDANGNTLGVRPPRGNLVVSGTPNCQKNGAGLWASGPFDICSTYNSADLVTLVQQPVEATACTPTASQPCASISSYDPTYGYLSATTDPLGHVVTYGYDKVNRKTSVTVGRYANDGANPVPVGCTTSTAVPWPSSGEVVCATTTAYDGVDNVIAVSDPWGTNQATPSDDGTTSGANRSVQTTFAYDAYHRATQVSTPRWDGVQRTLTTASVYDADGNVIDSCPPRQFSEGPPTCNDQNAATQYFSTHTAYSPADQATSVTAYQANTPVSGTPTALTSTVTYDADGNVVAATDANGHTTSNNYTVLDRLNWVAKQRSVQAAPPATNYSVTGYGYDPSGNRIWSSEAGSLTQTLPASGTPVGTAAPGTRNTLTAYDGANRPTDTVVAAVDASSTPTTVFASIGVTDANGGTNIHTHQVYDAGGHVVGRLSPRAYATSSPNYEFMVWTDYNNDGQPVAAYVPRYDSAGLSTLANSVFSTQASQTTDCPATLVPQESVAGIAYPAGTGLCATALQYDPAGRVTKKLLPTAGVNSTSPSQLNWSSARYDSYAYSDDGLVLQSSSPDPSSDTARATATMAYDANGTEVGNRSPLGNAAAVAAPACTTLSAPPVHWTSTGPFDTCTTFSHGKLQTSIQNPAGSNGGVAVPHVEGATFDANGNQVTSVDAYLATTVTAYTTTNFKQSVATPSGGALFSPFTGQPDVTPYASNYTYDGVGNTLTVSTPSATARDATNPSGVATQYSYTNDNLLATTLTPPGSGNFNHQTDAAYDAFGQRLSEHTYQTGGTCATRPLPPACDGGTVSYQYNLDGRLQTETPATTTPPTPAKSFTYDADGNLTGWSAGGVSQGSSSYYIDGTLRTTGDPTYTAQWSYDGGRRLATLAMTKTGQTSTEAARYMNSGQTAELRTSLNSPATTAETRSYDHNGQVTGVNQANGAVATLAWNNDSTLANLTLAQSGTTLAAYSYSYDSDYRILASFESAPSYATSFHYQYWADGRLSQYSYSGGQWTSIFYDHNGNRTGWTPTQGNAVTSTYFPDDGLATNTIGSIGYDTSGRQTSDGCTTNTYDGFGRLTTAAAVVPPSRPAGCAPLPTGATSTTSTYDALDRQTQRTDVIGAWTSHYATMGSTVGLLQFGSGSGESDRQMVVDAAGKPSQVMEVGGAKQFLTDDGNGNLGDVTGPAGAAACLLQYDLYGTTIGMPTGSNYPCVGGGTQLTQLGYKFTARDSTTGNYTFGTRSYDPSKAAYTSPDAFQPGSTGADLSIGTDPLTADRYVYVNGDPVNLRDPSGHRFTTGNDTCDSNPYANGCGGATLVAIATPQDKQTLHATQQAIWHRRAAVAQFRAHASAAIQRLMDRESSAQLFELRSLGAQELRAGQAEAQAAEAAGRAEDAAAAKRHRTCDSIWCGFTQGLYGTVTGLATIMGGPAASQGLRALNHVTGADNNPWLAGDCSGWCWGGQGAAFMATTLAGGAGAIGKLGKAVEAVDALEGGAAEGLQITDWSGYPASLPRPTGPLNLLSGDEYAAARAAANSANRAVRAQADGALDGLQIHEIQPVKWGGDPTDIGNKVAIPPALHYEVSSWWNAWQRALQGR